MRIVTTIMDGWMDWIGLDGWMDGWIAVVIVPVPDLYIIFIVHNRATKQCAYMYGSCHCHYYPPTFLSKMPWQQWLWSSEQ
jgi:hypothetical protein